MEAKFTPGPWLIEGNTIYALMHDGWRKGVEQFRNRFFAQVQVDVSCSDEEREANARLIAAAPELLAALKKARRFVVSSSDPVGSELDEIDAAIAKATGASHA